MEKKLGARIACFLRLLEETQFGAVPEESPYTESLLSLEIKEYFQALAEREALAGEEADQDSLLYRACCIFGLDEFEKMCLGFSVLGEMNPYFEKFYIYMNNDWNSGYLTFDTAIRLYTMELGTRPEFYRYFEEDNKLASYFFHILKPEGKSRVRWGFCCRSAFFSFLISGLPSAGTDGGAAEWFLKQEPEAAESMGKPEIQEPEAAEILGMPVFQKLELIIGRKESAFLYGLEPEEELALLREYGGQKRRPVCFLNICRIAAAEKNEAAAESRRNAAFDVLMQAVCQGACVCVYFLERKLIEDEDNRQFVSWLAALFQKHDISLLILGDDGCWDCINPGIWEIKIEKWEVEADTAAWKRLAAQYPVSEGISLDFFANTYGFTVRETEQVLLRAEKTRILQKADSISQRILKESCISRTGNEGNHLVTVVDAAYGFDDLVLPRQQLELLHAACNRVRYKARVYGKWGFGEKIAYGKGVSMVFSGPPGTGKSMSAQVVADTLGTALYRVDLAAVVSKYIGETEKNLQSVFEAAKKGHGVLFFDEADVLFSRRTEVKDSHDKHSNMESAYLLQKMEEYEGVVILATNYIQNIDEAFKRRIRFFIEFPLPDEQCRLQLWEKAFPKQAELAEALDYAFLAKQFELSGSSIKNIALQAAFFAAEEEKGVGMEHIVRALLAEARKEGRRISREELREYGIYY